MQTLLGPAVLEIGRARYSRRAPRCDHSYGQGSSCVTSAEIGEGKIEMTVLTPLRNTRRPLLLALAQTKRSSHCKELTRGGLVHHLGCWKKTACRQMRVVEGNLSLVTHGIPRCFLPSTSRRHGIYTLVKESIDVLDDRRAKHKTLAVSPLQS